MNDDAKHRSTVLDRMAERTAGHPDLEAAVIGSVREVLPGIIRGVLCEMYGGESISVRVRMPKSTAAAREVRNRRIVALRASGMHPREIARQVGLTERHVWRVLNGSR